MALRLNSENNSELAEDDFEKYGADVENLIETLTNNSSEDSISLGFGDTDEENEDMFLGGGYGKGKALNNSFTGPYGNMDHILGNENFEVLRRVDEKFKK
jgi:hypothetical protein